MADGFVCVTTQVQSLKVHGSRLEQPTVNCEPDNLSSYRLYRIMTTIFVAIQVDRL